MGVALFKDHPNAMYPFSLMDAQQRQYVEDVVATCMAQFRQRDAAVVSGSCPKIAANVVMQMGGGCILYAESRQEKENGPCGVGSNRKNNAQGQQHQQQNIQQQKRVSAKDVFETLCDCIFTSKRYVLIFLYTYWKNGLMVVTYIQVRQRAGAVRCVQPGGAARGGHDARREGGPAGRAQVCVGPAAAGPEGGGGGWRWGRRGRCRYGELKKLDSINWWCWIFMDEVLYGCERVY